MMRLVALFALLVGVPCLALSTETSESVDGRVVQIKLPPEDYTLMYMEAREVFTVMLEGKSAYVEGKRLYIGDGEVAVELRAHETDGIMLQGEHQPQGTQIKKGSHIQLKDGYKRASELKPGDTYVVLPVIFDK